MGRRTLLLIAAIVVALLGVGLVWMYAQNAANDAQAGQERVTVLVAKTKIEVGTSGTTAAANGAFEQKTIAANAVTPGALSSTEPIANQVALVPVFPGQQIIPQQWGTSGQTSGLAIPAGQIAMSVQLGDPQRVAGFVAPGSTVAIFASGTSGNSLPAVRLLLENIQVLAVGPTTLVSGSTNTEQIPAAILTLAVTQEQAQKLIYASGAQGSTWSGLYFALMNADSKLATNNPGANSNNLFVGR